ncbi:MAG: Uma2 family endonuclease [Anaerolineae bacterium]
MSAMPDPKHWTVEAYLAFEATSEIKHEYFDGEIYAMAGASPNHNRISGSTYAAVYSQLRKRPCDVFGSDQRVRVNDIHYVYPDLSIVCGTPEFDTSNPPSLLNPTILIEVLSPSTEDDDRGRKDDDYRALPGLREFLFIAQDRCHIIHYVRQTEHQWLLTDVLSLDAVLELKSIHCTLALADVYEKVTFDDGQP